MQEKQSVALSALQRLKDGNKIYLSAEKCVGDVSLEKRQYTAENGQLPYAVIVGCADSRVIPEAVFSSGIGELFVIRVAGNVVGETQLGSIEYAVEHLGCRLVVVLGHTHCGAVGAALEDDEVGGYIKCITDEIKCALAGEKDATKASVLNALQSVEKIKANLKDIDGLLVVGALYHTESGTVDFFD